MKEFNCKKAMSLKDQHEKIEEQLIRVRDAVKDERTGSYYVYVSVPEFDIFRHGWITETQRDELVGKLLEASNKKCEEFKESISKLSESIREAEGRATARTITANGIILELLDITEKLHISKKAMNGIKLYCDMNAQTFPGAYKYIPQSTVFEAEFRNGSWRIAEVKRDTCGTARVRIIHTEESKAAILARFSRW